MALGDNNPTLLDLATRSDAMGNIMTVVEILNEVSEILDDMTWVEGNLPTGHKTTVRTGIPQPTWRKLYGGVQPTKSRTAQIIDTTGMLEAYAEIDKALADLNGNTAAFRMSEDKPHIEGIHQELSDTIFYGNETMKPEAFTGFAARYNDLSAENADNIIDAGGTGADNRSIWLIGWGPETCHGIVPKGSTAGLQQQDKGQVTIEDVDGAGGRMEAYRTHYRFDAGLTVRDWRYVVRICNIPKSDLSITYVPATGKFETGPNLSELLFQAMELIPNMGMARPAFYMSRDIRTVLRQQTAAAVQGSVLEYERVGGKLVASYQGVPLRRVDALSSDEAQVT